MVNENNTVVEQSLPEGEIMNQEHLYKSDIKRTLDRYAGTGTYEKLISNPITDLAIGTALKLTGFSTSVSFAATALSWAASDLMSKQQSWWNDSLIMILEGDISCVRVTHIRNTVSDYPAAYLIIERM